MDDDEQVKVCDFDSITRLAKINLEFYGYPEIDFEELKAHIVKHGTLNVYVSGSWNRVNSNNYDFNASLTEIIERHVVFKPEDEEFFEDLKRYGFRHYSKDYLIRKGTGDLK